MFRLIVFALLHVPLFCNAATIYLCRAYGGGEFWASATCSQHKALIVRIASVPDGMSFQGQVEIANQQARAGQKALDNVSMNQKQIQPASASPVNAECRALAIQVQRIDEQSSKLQSAYMQDALAKEKRDARSRQSLLRCG